VICVRACTRRSLFEYVVLLMPGMVQGMHTQTIFNFIDLKGFDLLLIQSQDGV